MLTELTSRCKSHEFYFPAAIEPGHVWVRDPASKSNPTTDPHWAKQTNDFIDGYIAQHGPFDGILGYSQGSMYATYTIARMQPGTFRFAVLFCGYLPLTHQGLLQTINSAAPLNVTSLLFMSENDYVIPSAFTMAQSKVFANSTILKSARAGHRVPPSTDDAFPGTVAFIKLHGNNSCARNAPIAKQAGASGVSISLIIFSVFILALVFACVVTIGVFCFYKQNTYAALNHT